MVFGLNMNSKLGKLGLRSGFTLIEVLVVISIMGVLVGVSVPGFRSYERNARVRNSAKALRSFFWEAQSLALAPKEADIESYKIFLEKGWGSDNEIEIKNDKDELISQMYLEKDVFIEDISLGGSVDNIGIDFMTGNKIGGNIVFSRVGNELVISVRSSKSILKYDVVLNSLTNNISIQKAP